MNQSMLYGAMMSSLNFGTADKRVVVALESVRQGDARAVLVRQGHPGLVDSFPFVLELGHIVSP